MPNCIVAILSFTIILLITIVYFSKERINNFENKVYKAMIITDLFLTIFATLFYFATDLPQNHFLLRDIIGKGVCALLTLWYTLFGFYITHLIFEKNFKKNRSSLMEISKKTLFVFIYIEFSNIDALYSWYIGKLNCRRIVELAKFAE